MTFIHKCIILSYKYKIKQNSMKTNIILLSIVISSMFSANAQMMSQTQETFDSSKKEGTITIPSKYKTVSVKENYIFKQTFKKLWQVYDKNGKLLLNGKKYIQIKAIFGNLFLVKNLDKRYLILKENGEKFLPGMYYSINIQKKVIICEMYSHFDIFLNDKKIAESESIATNGKLICLYRNHKTNVLNTDGIFVLQKDKYEEVYYNSDHNTFKVREKTGYFGLISAETGETIVPCEYKNIKYNKQGELIVKSNNIQNNSNKKWRKFDQNEILVKVE